MVKFAIIFFTVILFILSCGPTSETGIHQRFTNKDEKEWRVPLKDQNTYLEETNIKNPSSNSESIIDSSANNKYSWLSHYDVNNNLINRIKVPAGYERIKYSPGSYPDWLRHLPLKPQGSEVRLFNGSLKSRQDVHFAIIEIDPGTHDLQQCADACIRLNAEYYYSKVEYANIHFKFTSGDNAQWIKWKDGYRPTIKGNKISWIKSANADSSYKNFRSYLNTVFKYAGTQSLSQELSSVSNSEIKPGDIFIKGGFPGHAVTVVDVAENIKTKEKIFLLAQSYMPAQEIHILKNFNNPTLSPWYTSDFTDRLDTPEWTFSGNCLKRFK